MTPSRSGTRCPPNQRRPPATRRRQPANCGCTVKVTFCVRGVLSPLLENLYMRRFVLGCKKLGLEQSLGTRLVIFFFQAEDGIRGRNVTGVQTCALPICRFTWSAKELAASTNCVLIGEHEFPDFVMGK